MQALGAGFGGLVVEDGHELVAALRGGHTLPAGAGLGAFAEGIGDERWEFDLGFHGVEEALGCLLAAIEAGLIGFDAGDPLAELAAGVLGEGVVPGAEAGLFVEQDGEFVGEFGFAGVEVGLEGEGGGVAEVSVASLLHGFVDEEEEAAALVGKE